MSTLYVLPQPPGDLAEQFAGLLADIASSQAIQLSIATSLADFSFNQQLSGAAFSANPAFQKFVSDCKERPWLDTASATATAANNPSARIAYTVDGQGNATISVSHPGHFGSPVLRLGDALQARFPINTRLNIQKARLPPSAEEAIRTRQAALDDLAAQSAKLTDLLADLATRSSEHLLQLSAQQQAHVTAITKQLEKEFSDRRAEMEAHAANERETLEEARRVHAAAVAQFETRESKYVRRDLLDKMAAQLEARSAVTLSTGTTEKRKIVHGLCIGALVVGIVLIGAAVGAHITNPSDMSAIAVAPLVSGTVLLASSLVYYIKWNDSWFKSHADVEFRNIKFEQDILRASWLAELLFEWRAEQGEQAFPQELVEGFSRGLFADPASGQVEHPVEALAALAKEASSIKVGKGAFEITRRSQ